ncbi:MAG TPA: hypothetical protein VF132_09455, partial [Rudaea sp.]
QGPASFCAGGNVTLMSSIATNNQWLLDGNPIGGATSQTYLANASGSYTDVVTNDIGCASSASTATVVTVNPLPSPPTITADTNGTGTQNQSCPEQPLTLHANGGAGVSYQWFQDNNTLNGQTSSTYVATGVGTYYVTLTDANACISSQSAGYIVENPTPHAPFVSFRSQDSSVTTLAICQGSSQIIDSDSATGIQWYKDGSPIPGAGSQSYSAMQSGTYTAQLNALGCHSQFGRNVTLNVTPTPATPTVTPGGPTTIFQGQSVTLTSSSAGGNQWYLNGNPIGGATSQSYVATASGDYSVRVTSMSCDSAQSAAVTVTVVPQADIALTMSDNKTQTQTGDFVNYIIEVTNADGPSSVNATITDALPPGLVHGSWACVSFNGAACASGYGNTLSDTATLPVGSEAVYIYSATVVTGDADDLLTNTASVAVAGGANDPVSTNDSATDTDLVHIFIDGFEGTPVMEPAPIGDGSNYVAATLRVNAGLLDTLTLMPTPVAVGHGADGKALFTIELARFGANVVLRAVTKDASGINAPSEWQPLVLEQQLVTLSWQTASIGASNGYLSIGGTSTPPLLKASTERDRLAQLWVVVKDSVPWLVLVTK